MFNALNLRKNYFIILLSVLSLTGVYLVLLSTSTWGVDREGDSPYYLLISRLFGNYKINKDIVGLYLCHLQPLFPLVLSWGHFIRIDPLEGARWFNAILFGLNIILMGIVTKKYTKSAWMGLSAALLLLTAPDILGIHLTVMSEPLFIFFMLLWLLLFFDYLKNSKLSILILSSIVAALASMTRFAGIPMIVTGLFMILFSNRGENLNKFIHAVIFSSIPCLSLFFWFQYSYIEDSPYQRHFVIHPVHLSYFRDMVFIFCSWFISPQITTSAYEKMSLFTIGVAFCFIKMFIGRHINETSTDDPKEIISTKFSILVMAFMFLYVACLILATTFYDADMGMYNTLDRYFIPLHAAGLIIFCGLMTRFFQRHSSFEKDIGKIIITYFILFYIVGSEKCLMYQYYEGDEFTSNPCRFSYIIRKIKTTTIGAPIYSNNFQAVYMWSDKTSFTIPFYQNTFSLERNSTYENQISQMMTNLKRKKGILVYFNKNTEQYAAPIKDLQKKIPLHLMAQDKCGSIFDEP